MAVMVRQSVKPDLLEKKLGDQLVYHLIVENLKVWNSLIQNLLIIIPNIFFEQDITLIVYFLHYIVIVETGAQLELWHLDGEEIPYIPLSALPCTRPTSGGQSSSFS